MKSLNFNRESWHFKVATEWGSMPKWFEDTNICDYSRAVVKGSFLLLASVVIALAAILGGLYWVANTIAWWFAGISTGVFVEETGPIVLSMIVVIGSVSWFIARSAAQFQTWHETRRYDKARAALIAPSKPDSFVRKAYRSWKDKTCVRVTLN